MRGRDSNVFLVTRRRVTKKQIEINMWRKIDHIYVLSFFRDRDSNIFLVTRRRGAKKKGPTPHSVPPRRSRKSRAGDRVGKSDQSTAYSKGTHKGFNKKISVPPLVTIQEGSSHPLGISVVIDITNLVLNKICEYSVRRQSA